MKNKLDLDTFIRERLAEVNEARNFNAWVKAEGWRNLYVRLTRRSLPTGFYDPVLDLASLEVRKPGTGTFTRLIERLRRDYPNLTIYVENVWNQRFQRKLVSLGFAPVDWPHQLLEDTRCYVLGAVQRVNE
jgi:hypothetical protein